uniref:Uncharacterized protein n=1 Tax=Arundo donax TaxID=35708 RepID=A0A0A9DPX4_ARUDO
MWRQRWRRCVYSSPTLGDGDRKEQSGYLLY